MLKYFGSRMFDDLSMVKWNVYPLTLAFKRQARRNKTNVYKILCLILNVTANRSLEELWGMLILLTAQLNCPYY